MSYKNEAQGSSTQEGVVRYYKGKRNVRHQADAAPSYELSSGKETDVLGSVTSEGITKNYRRSGKKGIEHPTQKWGARRSKKAQR